MLRSNGVDGRLLRRRRIVGLEEAGRKEPKTLRAADETGARTIIVGGGVAANGVLRSRIEQSAEEHGIRVIVPRPGLCTDNAAMIGAAGFFRARAGARAGADLAAKPSLKLAVPAVKGA